MKYDFEHIVDRTDDAAFKYVEMNMLYPDLSKDTVPFSMADMEFADPPEVIEGIKNFLDLYSVIFLKKNKSCPHIPYHWKAKEDSFFGGRGVLSSYSPS